MCCLKKQFVALFSVFARHVDRTEQTAKQPLEFGIGRLIRRVQRLAPGYGRMYRPLL